MAPRLNPRIARWRNSKTGAKVPVDGSRPVGLHEGAPVVVEYDLPSLEGRYVDPKRCGMWRYAPVLPVDGMPERYAGDVGATPTMPHEGLGKELGVELWVKNECGNPSGSFKDRGLAMGIALGVALGAKRFCLPTQGNAGVAASMYSARAGLAPALVYMPVAHEGSIYHRSAATYGAEVRFFGANIAAAGKKMREDLAAELQSGAYVDISTFFEPGRLEGKKTMGYEIADSFADGAMPDVIVYPTGGGTGLVGIWKAFRELQGLGKLPEGGPLPRMVAVQSDRCAPVVASFHAGEDAVTPITSEGTVADGLDVPGAIMGHAILSTLRESKGTAVAVTEEAIVSETRALGRAGVSASFEGGATLAALRKLRQEGGVREGDRVLLLVTAGQLVGLSSAGANKLDAR